MANNRLYIEDPENESGEGPFLLAKSMGTGWYLRFGNNETAEGFCDRLQKWLDDTFEMGDLGKPTRLHLVSESSLGEPTR